MAFDPNSRIQTLVGKGIKSNMIKFDAYTAICINRTQFTGECEFHENKPQLLPNSFGHLSSLLIIVSLRRTGAFNRDFNKDLAPQSGNFTRALKFEKLNQALGWSWLQMTAA